MKINIDQPPLNTSLMGVIRGVADYFELPLSTPALFGRTGHAFLINIHANVCPSGPYVWDIEPFIALLENSGIRMENHGFFGPNNSLEERRELEETLRQKLDGGLPCSLLNLDNQLITGYDEDGFHCVQPWECDFPPPRLTNGSWREMGGEIHASFFSYSQVERLDTAFSIQRSLLYALDLTDNPESHTLPGYTCGTGAYDVWIQAVKDGLGSTHGNWWNATVWAECRKMAAEYFREIAGGYPACSEMALELALSFDGISRNLESVSKAELPADEKADLLAETRDAENGALPLMGELAENIET